MCRSERRLSMNDPLSLLPPKEGEAGERVAEHAPVNRQGE